MTLSIAPLILEVAPLTLSIAPSILEVAPLTLNVAPLILEVAPLILKPGFPNYYFLISLISPASNTSIQATLPSENLNIPGY
ncbi:hypothetical protein [Dendronalium sp. ChiSLP03b]|uniref:hypothetical protein n=1 Tax=Dendronalium sp. ChiSLP03b TaxID=3075381 RepID=UPI002AD4F62D|nr:hypothetical protein [Dendronalium sp. ChiSLP03b]MDZ8202999.1 hypothetical protein [Dendronalium sp. ChiSLP03b]